MRSYGRWLIRARRGSSPSGLADAATLAAHAAGHIGGVGAVLEVVSAVCRQSGLQRCRPFRVRLGEPPHLIRRQAEVTKHRTERQARIDRVQQLLAHLGG